MRKFVKFLGGDKNSASYHSIWATPAPESGSRAVVTNTKKEKEVCETLSTKKPQSTLHISKLNQPAVAELSSPTDSTATPKASDSIAELSATDSQVSELDGSRPTTDTPVHTTVLKEEERVTANFTPKPTAGPDADLLIFSDGTERIPGFGRQFGIAPTSIIREQKNKQPESEPESEPKPEPQRDVEASPQSPEAFFQQVDEELEALYTDYLKSSGKQRSDEPKKKLKKVKKSKPCPKTEPEACIICLEPFSASGVKAPDKLSIACQHTPSVCYICLSKSIKHDLETKFWDEIKCPECNTPFIHEDIKRFADQETFTRYDKLSFRHAVNADENFIWCLECDFGQLHEPGADQPAVQCYNCAAESCFKHAIKWHDGFTCDEYDALLWDPDSYKSIKAKNEGTTAHVRPLRKITRYRLRNEEQSRQSQLHEAQKKTARKKQEVEAARVREEKRLQAQAEAEAEAARLQEQDKSEEENYEEEVKDDFKEKIEMLKRRMREVELSVKTVENTTKRCPGCQWPIEKNSGCDHMTCRSLSFSLLLLTAYRRRY
ncbi:hypothetical protein BDW74DRAFT_148637 [Aspergillus multicolor]|uniref:E3 ubiquitin-protein ligase n=1 Tax=Aspergillus multicolor TaxID=41759 RepID=UPI003CCDFDB2